MSVTFRILSHVNIVHVRYVGFAALADTITAAEACTTHPDFRPGLPHLFDLGGATGFEKDFPRFFEMQAKLAEAYLPHGVEQLIVFHAPQGAPREMAEMVRKTWEDVPQVVVRLTDRLHHALDILHLTPADLADTPAQL